MIYQEFSFAVSRLVFCLTATMVDVPIASPKKIARSFCLFSRQHSPILSKELNSGTKNTCDHSARSHKLGLVCTTLYDIERDILNERNLKEY
jgi:hypothetical protein